MRTILSLLILLFAINSYSQDFLGPQTKEQGVYSKFESFLSGKPAIPAGFTIDTTLSKRHVWKGTYSFVPYNKKGPMKEVWGFCDGKHNYINYRNSFFKIFKENENYVTYAYAIPKRSVGGSMMTFYAGGLIGSLLYSAETNSESRKYLQKYYIDPYTGQLTISKEVLDFFNQENRYAELIIYRQNDNDNTEEINFSINDSLHFSFPPLSYVELILPITRKPYKISSDSKINKEIYVSLDLNKTLYLKCSRFKHDDEIILFQQAISEASGELESLESKKHQMKMKRKQVK